MAVSASLRGLLPAWYFTASASLLYKRVSLEYSMHSRQITSLTALSDKSQVLAGIRWCVSANVKRKASIEWLLSVLAHTTDAQVRNRAALALADLRVQAAVPIIIDLLSAERTVNHRGSLLYALQSLDYLDYLDEISSHLGSNVYEVVEMALQLLEQLPRRVKIRRTRNAIKRLEELASSPTNTTYEKYINHGLMVLRDTNN